MDKNIQNSKVLELKSSLWDYVEKQGSMDFYPMPKFSVESIDSSKVKITIHLQYKANLQIIGRSNDQKTKVNNFILIFSLCWH